LRILALNLFEVSPRATQLRFLLQAAGVWRESFPDDKLFWVEQGVGARIAAWIEALCHKEPSSIGQCPRGHLPRPAPCDELSGAFPGLR